MHQPWQEMSRLIQAGSAGALEAFLGKLSAAETARSVSRLSSEDRVSLLNLLDLEQAADLVEEVSPVEAVDLIEDLTPDRAAAIIERMQSDHRADLIGDLSQADATVILDLMTPEEAREIRRLLAFPDDTAGGVMMTEYLTYGRNQQVSDVLRDLQTNRQEYADYNVQYAYVVETSGKLVGVLRMRDLVLSSPDASLSQVMLEALSVPVDLDLEELDHFFDGHPFLGVPVVDSEERLMGVALRSSVRRASAENARETFLRATGIAGGEEVRSLPLLDRARGRLSWLSVNVLLNVVAASVIARYQDTLAELIALAIFLPIVSDMSGCSGNQALAVSIRELSMGLITPRDFFYVLKKELGVGILNGIVLGLILGATVWLWQRDPILASVVGLALALNTVIAVCLGGVIPLLLKGMDKDPALASGPLLTTVTDMAGFLMVLSFARTALDWTAR